MTGLDGLLERLFNAPPPDEIRLKARLLALDTLGCMLAGFEVPKVAELRSLTGDEAASFALAACWHEACEGLARAHGRPGVPVIAACMSLGQRRGAMLRTFVDAVIVGYEVGGRMGEVLRIRPGMHVDASWPALGVAAAVVRLMDGSAAAARAAIEIAGSQLPFSLYLPVEQGADARNTYLGHAAWLGTHAAQAALSGCDAPRGAVERFAELALGLKDIVVAPARDYVIREAYLKPFAAVRHVHYGVEAALRLRPQIADTRNIGAIALSIYPEALTYCGNRAPHTVLQAQFSLSFGVAAALRFGRLDAEQYSPASFNDAELRRLEALVTVTADPSIKDRAATLRIGHHGRELQASVSAVKGDPALPMSEEECRAKFVRHAAPRLARPAAEALADAMLRGPETQPLNSILQEALRP